MLQCDVNKRTAVISLIVTLVMAALAWFALKPKPVPPPPPQTWLKSLDPLEVTAFAVRWSDGKSAAIERSEVPGVWVLRQSGAGAEPPWPVPGNRVNGAVRLLSELDAIAPSEGQAPAAGTRVTVRTRDGAEHALTISEAALGGKAMVVVHGPPDTVRLADAGLAKMFQDGLRAWRESGVLEASAGDASNPGEVSRVRLQTVGRQITLGRTKGKWGVREPVAAPADGAACNQLVEHLGQLPVQRILAEKLADSATGLSNPTAMVECDSDFVVTSGDSGGGGTARRVLLQKITVGGPADTTREKLYALVSAVWMDPATRKAEPVWGPALIVVNRSDLNTLRAEPSAYLSKLSSEVPAADVSAFVLTASGDAMTVNPKASESRRVRVVRTLDGWRYRPEQGEPRVIAPAVVTRLESFIRLLTDQPADAVGLEPPRETSPMAVVSLESGLGAAQEVGIGAAEVTPPGNGAQTALVVRSGSVFRVYVGKVGELVRWIAEELPPEG
jgi:hypothetical protein